MRTNFSLAETEMKCKLWTWQPWFKWHQECKITYASVTLLVSPNVDVSDTLQYFHPFNQIISFMKRNPKYV